MITAYGEKEKCWVFIDDSNLIIEGWKYYARKQKLLTKLDYRMRVDMGRLVDHLIGKRTTEGHHKAWLYGSEPPAIDTVWKMIRDQNIKVRTYRKSSKGKEKEVDTSLVTDAIAEAATNKDSTSSLLGTFIFVAGDRDYMCCVEKILKFGFSVEIVTWKSCIASDFIALEKKQKSDKESKDKSKCKGREAKLKIRFLDEIMEENSRGICFFNVTWKIYLPTTFKEWLNGSLNRIPRDRTIIVEYETRPNFDKGNIESLVQKVTVQFGLPFLSYWKDECTLYLIVSVPEKRDKTTIQVDNEDNTDESILHDIDDLGVQIEEHILETSGQLYDFTNLYIKFHDGLIKFLSSFGTVKKMSTAVEYFNQASYDQRPLVTFNTPEAVIATNNRGYTVVSPRYHPRKLRQKFSDPCRYSFNCQRGKLCERMHTPDERRYFDLVPDPIMRRGYKTKQCRHGARCKQIKDSAMCGWAHGKVEALCYVCRKVGDHFADECPEK